MGVAMSSCPPRGVCWESQELTFSGTALATVNLSNDHVRPPHITVTPSDSVLANFNFYVSSIEFVAPVIGPHPTDSYWRAKVRCSNFYTGTVYVHAVSTL